MLIESGVRFGRLVVVLDSVMPLRKHKGKPVVMVDASLCICDCGKWKTIRNCSLRAGRTLSCGCYHAEQHTTHRLSKTKEYGIWAGIKQRCLNPKAPEYPKYGARGITVCDRWRNSFENFIADMGPAPEGLSIERIDNNAGYHPGNCKWATRFEQMNNRRITKMVEVDGISKPLSVWALERGMKHITLTRRLRKGWDPKAAVYTPVRAWERKTA